MGYMYISFELGIFVNANNGNAWWNIGSKVHNPVFTVMNIRV